MVALNARAVSGPTPGIVWNSLRIGSAHVGADAATSLVEELAAHAGAMPTMGGMANMCLPTILAMCMPTVPIGGLSGACRGQVFADAVTLRGGVPFVVQTGVWTKDESRGHWRRRKRRWRIGTRPFMPFAVGSRRSSDPGNAPMVSAACDGEASQKPVCKRTSPQSPTTSNEPSTSSAPRQTILPGIKSGSRHSCLTRTKPIPCVITPISSRTLNPRTGLIIVARLAGEAVSADGYLANMGTEDFLACLSRPALEAVCEGTPIQPRRRVKDTRAALVGHFREGRFVDAGPAVPGRSQDRNIFHERNARSIGGGSPVCAPPRWSDGARNRTLLPWLSSRFRRARYGPRRRGGQACTPRRRRTVRHVPCPPRAGPACAPGACRRPSASTCHAIRSYRPSGEAGPAHRGRNGRAASTAAARPSTARIWRRRTLRSCTSPARRKPRLRRSRRRRNDERDGTPVFPAAAQWFISQGTETKHADDRTTLKLAEDLKKGGFNEKQTESLVNLGRELSDRVIEKLATKDDLDDLNERLTHKIDVLRKDMKALDKSVDDKLTLLEQRMVIKLGGLMIGGLGILVLMDRLLPPAG